MTKRQLDVVGTRSRPAGGGGPRGSANADGRVTRAAVKSVGVLLALMLSLSVAIIGQASAQLRGALAIDERQGDHYGWAVNYETAAEAHARALRECGAGCSVVLTFARCGAFAADQTTNSTAAGWAESFDSGSRRI